VSSASRSAEAASVRHSRCVARVLRRLDPASTTPIISTAAAIKTTIKAHGVELLEVAADVAVVGGVFAAVGCGVDPVPRVASRGGLVSRGVVTVADGSVVSVCACRPWISGAALARRSVNETSASKQPAAALTTLAVALFIDPSSAQTAEARVHHPRLPP
jgi:hypothetical protein